MIAEFFWRPLHVVSFQRTLIYRYDSILILHIVGSIKNHDIQFILVTWCIYWTLRGLDLLLIKLIKMLLKF